MKREKESLFVIVPSFEGGFVISNNHNVRNRTILFYDVLLVRKSLFSHLSENPKVWTVFGKVLVSFFPIHF